jgi:CAAX prenyl protease-like protein
MTPDPIPRNYGSDSGKQPVPGSEKHPVREDLAYILPMAVFLAFIWVGTKGAETGNGNTWYPWAYLARAIVVAAMLVAFRHAYTRIRWNQWWLGLIVGVAGIFQWVGMQHLLEARFEFFRPSGIVFNPDLFFANGNTKWAFEAVRLFGAVLVVPFMEELFWRDFCWRSIIAPNDFKLAVVGEWDWKAFVIVPLIFAVVHGNWWLTAIVWAFMVGGLLAYTKSLGACIIAHATTNLLLGVYVLYSKQWSLW